MACLFHLQGSDGAFWFVYGAGTNKVGRVPIATSKSSPQLTTYNVPTSGGNPSGITR
jgi:hypothetical protein